MTMPRSTPQQKSGSQQYAPSHQARAVIMPTSSQTPVSLVSFVPTPTAYATQPMTEADGTAFTIVPAEAVVQSGQGGVAIAMPPVKAVPPGCLPLDNAAIVMQQPSQHGAAVKCIIDPMVPTASTSVVYSQTASIPATITGSQTNNTSSPKALSSQAVYHTQVVGGKSMPVATTKPYAIVSAQPTESVEIQGIAVDKRGTPVISSQVPVGYSVVPVQTTVTPTVGAKQVIYSAEKTHSSSNVLLSKSTFTSRVLQGTKGNGQAASLDKVEKAPDELATTANLEDVGKKIRDAFVNHSEVMLIAAFEDAWKKFQENGKRYPSTTRKIGHSETTTTSGKPCVPPNAEVISVPGTSSRLSLIRPTHSRSKISVPKTSPDQLTDAQPSPCIVAPQQQKQQQVQYLYYADGSSQPQVFAVGSDYSGTTALYAVPPSNAQPAHTQQLVKQAQPQGLSSQKMYQVQTSGIYVPARATGVTLGSSKQAAVVMEQQVMGGSNKAVVQASRNQIALAENVVAVQQAPEQVPTAAVQHLSVLRKTLPVIENGGGYGNNSVVKRKSGSTTSKAVRQCALCTKEATYLCSGCRRIWYCGKDCQVKFYTMT